MRYWMWWNDLVQGPFELDELVSLKAFSDDLLVCMEDREEWIPASRVADFAPALDQWRERRSLPFTPPPPPPTRPPTLAPLQGEFFHEGSEQQMLLKSEDEPKGPYAFHPVTTDSDLPVSFLIGRGTMPFHFVHPTHSSSVLDMPTQAPLVLPFERPQITFVPPPVIKESPIPKPEEETAPAIELELLQEKPQLAEPIEEKSFEEKISAAPVLPEPIVETKRLEWMPWIMGVMISLGILGSAGYWVMDRYSTHSAIVEANRMESPKPDLPPPPVPVMAPVAPGAAPPVALPVKSVRKPIKKTPQKNSKPAKPVKALVKAPVQKVSRPVVPVPVPEPTPAVVAPASVPGMAVPAPVPAPAASPIPAVDEPLVTPAPPAAVDPWKNHQTQAISFVMSKTLPKSKVTVGSQAKTILQQMHEKELIHAAETGERLYLPDKMTWTALQEQGAQYRVYLNFMASQANGERVQVRSYQFIVDLVRHSVRTEDAATQQDLLTQPAELTFKHNPMATDIDSILGGVDTYNKHKVQMMIVKKNRRNKTERSKMEASMASAQSRIQRAVIYFRRTYPEKALQNVAKAYTFTELIKG